MAFRVAACCASPGLDACAAGLLAKHLWLSVLGIALETLIRFALVGPELLMDWSDAWRYTKNPSWERERPTSK